MPSRSEHGKLVIVAPQQAIGGAAHQEQIFRIGVDAAHDAEAALEEQRRLQQPLVDEVGEVADVPDVVALELEARAVRLAEPLDDAADVGERIAENDVFRAFDMALFPGMFPLRIPAPALWKAKFIDPMLSEHSSGLATSG